MKKKTIILTSIVGISILVGFFVIKSRSQFDVPEYSSVVAEVEDLYQTVSETGAVIADLEVRYGWEVSGRVVAVEKEVGDDVNIGDVIARLDSTQQDARVSEAQSRLAAARSSLLLELAGPSDEQKAQSQAAVAQAEASVQQAQVDLAKAESNGQTSIRSAEIALADAQANLVNTGNTNQQAITAAYEDALQDANGAVIDALSAMASMSNIQQSYSELTNSSPTALALATKKGQAVEALVGVPDAGRWRSDQIINQHGGVRGDVEALLASVSPSHVAIDAMLIRLQYTLRTMIAALDTASVALNASNDASASDKTTIETERSSIETELATVTNAVQTIKAALLSDQSGADSKQLAYEKAIIELDNAREIAAQNVAAAEALVQVREAALQQSQASYNALVAPPRDVDLGALRANVSRELASLQQYQADQEKTKLVALSDGVISTLSIDVGETIAANQEVLAIISPALSIEVDVSESDIAKVQLNDKVSITLDSFGDDITFAGHVVRIDPAQTEISGVIYYKTDIVFDTTNNKDIRPGMTANIDIQTDVVRQAVVVPQRAILEENGERYVRVVEDPEKGIFRRQPVTMGLRGDNGLVHITSGLSGGEEVVTFVKEIE